MYNERILWLFYYAIYYRSYWEFDEITGKLEELVGLTQGNTGITHKKRNY